MWSNICECIEVLAHPSPLQVLDRLRTLDVCTGTACYETVDELASSTPPAIVRSDNLFLLSLFVGIALAAFLRSPTLRAKTA